MTIALTPLIVAVLGLLLYFFAKPPKVQRVGEILFFVGAFWFVAAQGQGHSLSIK